MILLDTTVVSELGREAGSRDVKRAVAQRSGDVWLSVVVIGEIRFGLARLPAGRRREALLAHYEVVERAFGDRVLPVTAGVARRWGDLRATQEAAGRALPLTDGLLAATALEHDLEVWTRNTRDFRIEGLRLRDPWEG